MFEIFVIGIPLATQATTLPTAGQGVAIYASQYSTVAFVYNASGITASSANLTTLANSFATYFNISLNVKFPNGSTYTQYLPISQYQKYVYFAVNPSTNDIEYVIILADMLGSNSTSKGTNISVQYLYHELGIPAIYDFENSSGVIQTKLYSIPVIGEVTANYIENDIQNPLNTKPTFFTETTYGELAQSITIKKISISTKPTNTVTVFAPFTFQNTGFTNTLQQSGALGKVLQSESSYRTYIWGRALINTQIFDPYASSGVDNLTFQLNYSTTGYLQIETAQMGWIASITNFPSKFTYLSYNFSNGYLSFLGFITTNDHISMAINGQNVAIYPSGQIVINKTTYYITLITITTKPASDETVNGLYVYYYNNSVLKSAEFRTPPLVYSPSLVITNYHASSGSNIVIQGQFNNTIRTITITVGQTPNITEYTALTTLSATAYEGVFNASVSSYYTTVPILSTPPSTILIRGVTNFNDRGNLTPTSASAVVTLLDNASLPFNNVQLNGISFNGIIVTPAYPIINGTTAMQYMLTTQYQNFDGEYEIEVLGSQIVMQNGQAVDILPPFSNTLTTPTTPASLSGTGLLSIDFESSPQDSYITLVDLGLWSNQTIVTVQAYSEDGNAISTSTGYFYAIVIPPRISVNYINGTDAIVNIYDPDSILDPSNITGSFTAIPSEVNYKGITEQGAVVFFGSTIYSTSGAFATTNFSYVPTITLGYKGTTIDGISYYELSANGQPIIPYPDGTYPSYLEYYGSNNPTVNFLFEQGILCNGAIRPAYVSGLNISYSSDTLSPEMQVGYAQIYPVSGTNYTINNYETFKVLSYDAPVLSPFSTNAFVSVAYNSSFVGATDYYVYSSTDYAVNYFYPDEILRETVTVPNITAKLYFASNVTPLYEQYLPLYYNETYYAANLPVYLALGTFGTLTWNAPIYQEFNIPATPLYLAKMLYVNVTLTNGQKYLIMLTTKNISKLFISTDAQQLQPYNGTYEFEMNISGLENILGLTSNQLNNSELTVAVYDFVTHETLVANTE